MNIKAALCGVAIVCLGAGIGWAQQSTPTVTTTGIFQLQDPGDYFGVGSPISLDNLTGAYGAGGITSGNQLVEFDYIAVDSKAGNSWELILTNGGDDVTQGSYNIDQNSKARAALWLNGIQVCVPQNAGNVTLGTLQPNTAPPATYMFSQVTGSLVFDCTATQTIQASFEFRLLNQNGGGGGGGGGNGAGGGTVHTGIAPIPGLGSLPSGSGSTPVTPPAPPVPQITLSHNLKATEVPLTLMSGDTVAVKLTSETFNFTPEVTFSAVGGGTGLTFAFDPAKIASPGNGTTTMTIGTTSAVVPGNYRITILARGEGQTGILTLPVTIACDPPKILGINQPRSTVVQSGSTANLQVTPSGSGPFTYQWYSGHRGSTLFPVSGANGGSFTTPALTDYAEYWVRITNPCGAVDSENAAITVKR